jgi:pimeloyl-ACP methyl ester carboxylesterase
MLVPIGQHQLSARISGDDTGLPSVVLENGGGGILATWSGLETALSAHTRVLNYERAGIGESVGPSDSVSASAVAERLAALINTTAIRTPVVLVGHSLGGLYARYFAARHQELVAGLVLLDSTPEDLPFPRFFRVKPTLAMWLLHGIARIGLLERIAGRGKLPPTLIAAIARFGHIRAVLAEISALPQVQAEVGDCTLPVDLPVLALSAGQRTLEPQAQRDHFHVSHAKLAAASAVPGSRHERIDGATHMSLLTSPEHATAVARRIVEFAQSLR